MINVLLSVVSHDAKQIAQQVRSICSSQKNECKIASETSLEKVRQYIASRPNVFDIYIIDGEDERVLSLCKIFRKANQLAKIILLKDIEKNNLNSYLIYRPSAIFPVTDFGKDFQKALIACIQQSAETNSAFHIKTKDLALKIRYDKILYFSSDKRIVSVFLDNGKVYGFYGKLSEILEKLPSNRFMQCHQSFIVNTDKIIALNKTEKFFLIEGNKQIDISKAKYAEASKLFFENVSEAH